MFICFSAEIALPTHSSILLFESHSNLQLHGLAADPRDEKVFVTAGDDGVLKFWDISQRRCIRRFTIDYAARALAWSPCGTYIIIGLGGNPRISSKDGMS